MIKLRDDLECLQGLEASFLAIIGEAVGAGWTDEESSARKPKLPAVDTFDPYECRLAALLRGPM
jgi:hypothetical protein